MTAEKVTPKKEEKKEATIAPKKVETKKEVKKATPKVTEYELKGNIKHNGTFYAKGKKYALSAELVKLFTAKGLI